MCRDWQKFLSKQDKTMKVLEWSQHFSHYKSMLIRVASITSYRSFKATDEISLFELDLNVKASSKRPGFTGIIFITRLFSLL